MGVFYSVGIRLMNFMIFFLIIILLPGIPPKTTFPFKPFNISNTRDLKGSLEVNNHLDNGERLFEGRLFGPESILARKNELYTGIHGGEVIKINGDHITHVAKFGNPCEGIYEESRCGRPLGLAFDSISDGLIVADAYYGIWHVDLKSSKKTILVAPEEILDGKIKRKAKLFNSVAVDKKGNIYWTDSSSDFTIEDGLYVGLANPSGRLFLYDRYTNTSTYLLDELFFPNGVVLSPKEDFVIVSETGSSRLLKYYLQGDKIGQSDVFVDGLPGNPDNLTPDDNGLWVPLIVARDSENPSILTVFSKFPTIRLFILRIFALLESPFRLINNVFPNVATQKFLHFTGHFETVIQLLPARLTILRVDWNGNILGSLHGFDQSVGHVSHVVEIGENLYLGSPFNRYMGKIKLPKAPQIKIRNVRYEGVNMEPVLPSNSRTTKEFAEIKTTQANIPRSTTPKSTEKSTPPAMAAKEIPLTDNQKRTKKAEEVTTTSNLEAEKPRTTKIDKNTQQQANIKNAQSTTTPKPITIQQNVKEPAPIVQTIPEDTQPPKQPKLKVIKKGGEHGEL